MPADLVGRAAPPRADAAQPRVERKPAALTARASLNAGALLLDHATRALVTLLITPLIVGSLGRALYGTWEMIGRMTGYLAAADGRPNQALRLVIAHEQGLRDDTRKRRHVGAALVVWLLFLPLMLASTAALVWFAPALSSATPQLESTVRVTCALLSLTMIFGGLIFIPEAVLQGSNLGYRRMGVQAGTSVLAGLLVVGALKLGFGLEGMGAAQVIVALATGVLFWILARTYVPWFGIARPARADVRSLSGMSAWYSVGDIVARLLLASDLIILGASTSASTVALFALTAFATRTTVNFHALIASAAMPGYADVLGRGQHERAATLRGELLTLSWVALTAIGAVVLLWNPSFVALWVGDASYAGLWTNLLLVLLALQTALIRCDAYVIDAALRPRDRVLISLLAAALAIGMMLPLTARFGMVGLCLGLLAGRMVQSIAYPLIATARFGRPRRVAFNGTLRPACITTAVFAAAAALGNAWHAHGWIVLATLALTTAIAAVVLCTTSGLDATQRTALRHRLTLMWRSVR
jgi:O-antigen/teichoic acid export membrane protein